LLPDRSSTNTTSRGRAGPDPAGGTTVSAVKPPWVTAEVVTASAAMAKRSAKSRSRRCPGPYGDDVPLDVGRQARADRAGREPVELHPQAERDRVREAGQQHRGSDTRGVGTASVSSAAPSPTDGRAAGCPDVAGATTSGKRQVASPSSTASWPAG